MVTVLPLPHLLPASALKAPAPPASSPPARAATSSPPARAAIRERGSGGEGIRRRGRRPDPVDQAQLAALQRAVAEASAVVVRLVDTTGEGSRERWYRVAVQPTLEGGLDVVSEWGRLPVGRAPRRLVTHHTGWDEVHAAVRRVLARRLRRGYTPHRA